MSPVACFREWLARGASDDQVDVTSLRAGPPQQLLRGHLENALVDNRPVWAAFKQSRDTVAFHLDTGAELEARCLKTVVKAAGTGE